MPTIFQEKPKPDYHKLQKQEQQDKPLSTPEQAEALESSEIVKEQIDRINQRIDQDIEENQNEVKKRMESAIKEAQTGEQLPELPELQKQAEQELSNTLEQLTKLASHVKRKLRETAKEEEPCKRAEWIVEQIFNVIQKLQDKEIGGQTIAETTILADRQNYLSRIAENLKALTSPDYIDEELKQAGPGEMIQSIAEAGYHIVSKQDEGEIKEYLEQLEHIKEDAAEKMGQSNREIDRIQGLKKKQRQEQESRIPMLKQEAEQCQSIIKQIEPNLEYQESLLKERDKIEELIKIGAITENELNQLKQSFEKTTEQLEQAIPKENREQAEKDSQEMQKMIEEMVAKSGNSGYAATLKTGINQLKKFLKYNPEQSSKIKKALVKAAEIGLAAVAVFLVSHIAESGLFGGGEAEAMVSADTSKEYAPEKVQELMRDLDYLKAEYGDELPEFLQEFEKIEDVNQFRAKALQFDKKTYQESLKYAKKPIQFENLSEYSVGVVSGELWQKMLKETLPKEFVDSCNVEKIICLPREEIIEILDEKYRDQGGIKKDKNLLTFGGVISEATHKDWTLPQIRQPGVIYLARTWDAQMLSKIDLVPSIERLEHLIFHELTHLQDWDSGMNSIARMIKLRAAITKRLDESDQFHTDYLNSYYNKEDKITKSKEYLAELLAEAWADPNNINPDNPAVPAKDKKIIEEFYPQFDAAKSAELRDEMLDEPILSFILNSQREYWEFYELRNIQERVGKIVNRAFDNLDFTGAKIAKINALENAFWAKYDDIMDKVEQFTELNSKNEDCQKLKEQILRSTALMIQEGFVARIIFKPIKI